MIYFWLDSPGNIFSNRIKSMGDRDIENLTHNQLCLANIWMKNYNISYAQNKKIINAFSIAKLLN